MKAIIVTLILMIGYSNGYSQHSDLRRIIIPDVGKSLFYIMKDAINDLKPYISSGDMKVYKDSSFQELINPQLLDLIVTRKNQFGEIETLAYNKINKIVVRDSYLLFGSKTYFYDDPNAKDSFIPFFYISVSEFKSIKNKALKIVFYDFLYEYCFKQQKRDTTNTQSFNWFGLDLYESFSKGYQEPTINFFKSNHINYEWGDTNAVVFKKIESKEHRESINEIDWERSKSIIKKGEIERLEVFASYSTFKKKNNLRCDVSYVGCFLFNKLGPNTLESKELSYGVNIKDINKILTPVQSYMFERIIMEVLFNPALVN